MATDLAEFLGAALGFNLLFGIPLLWGGVAHRRRHASDPAAGTLRLPAAGGGHHRAGRRHRRLLPDRDRSGSAGLGRDRLSCGRAPVQRHRERAAGDGHPRRHGHAARHLSALGADAGPHRRTRPAAAAAALPLRDHRCRYRHGDGRADQRRHADHGRVHLLPRRPERDRHTSRRRTGRSRRCWGQRPAGSSPSRCWPRACPPRRSARWPAR